MASRVIEIPKAKDQGVVLQNPIIPGFSSGGGGGGGFGGSSQFSGIDNPEALDILMKTLGELSSGGTAEMQRQQGERNKQIVSARGTLSDYTKNSAFQDAADLMAQNLRRAMEAQMPQINKAVENAGTSGGSMAALLSQKLATEASQASGALGAEQAKAYGGISAQLQGVLEALTRVDRGDTDSLLKALDLFKTSRSAQSSYQAPTNPTMSVTSSGGGTFYQPVGADAPAAPAAAPAAPTGYWGYYTGNTHAKDQPVGSDTFGQGGIAVASSNSAYNLYGDALSTMYENNLAGNSNWGYGD